MKRFALAAAAVALVAVVTASPAVAFELIQPNTEGNARLEAGKRIDDTVFTAGQDVDIRGDIAKDLFAAGNNLDVNGRVSGNLLGAGSSAKVTGTVDGDLIVAGGSVLVTDAATVKGDVLLFAGSAEIAGKVTGKVTAYAGSLTLDSAVGGDVNVQADKLTLGEAAAITGNLTGTLGSGLPENADAKVGGTVDLKLEPSTSVAANAGASMTAVTVVSGLYKLVSVLVTGLILLLLLPKRAESLREQAATEAPTNILYGILTLVAVPVLFILSVGLFVTLPLGFLTLALFTVFAMLGSVAANLWVGDLLGKRKWSAFAALAAGAALLTAISFIPVLGPVVTFIAWLAGLGSVLRFTWQSLAISRR